MRGFAAPVNRDLTNGKTVEIGDEHANRFLAVVVPLRVVPIPEIGAAVPFQRGAIAFHQIAHDDFSGWQGAARQNAARQNIVGQQFFHRQQFNGKQRNRVLESSTRSEDGRLRKTEAPEGRSAKLELSIAHLRSAIIFVVNCSKKLISWTLCVALFSSFFAGCKLQNDDPKAMREWQQRYGKDESKQASKILNTMPRDDLGRVVELRKIPQRLVVIGPGAVETLFQLGIGQKIVGRDSYFSYPPEIAERVKVIPVAGDFKGPNAEQTLALNPDLVIITGETYGRDRVDLWQKQIGVPVACLAATTLGEVANGMQKLAKWTNTKAPAGFASDILKVAKNVDTVDAKGAKTKPSAMIEVTRKPFWAAGSDTLVGDVLRAAGFENAAKIQGYKQLNLENLLTQQPQFYVVTSSELKTPADVKTKLAAERIRVLDELRRTPGVKGLKCVQQGRVLIIPADWALRPGPRLGLAVAALREQKQSFGAISSTR